MAPIKHNRDSARNRDKTKRRRRPAEHANHLLYRCMGDLCGEECDQELTPVAGRRSDAKRASQNPQPQDVEMDAAGSDADDADYAPDDQRGGERRRQPTMKAGGGRVGKATAKKTTATAKQIKDMPVKLGLQKAERYLCNALDFGVQAGYLTPKDAKGRVLRVASGLLQTNTTNSVKRINTDAMDARALERRGGAAQTRAATQQRRGGGGPPQLRDSQYDPTSSQSQEVRDNEGDVTDSKRHRRSGGHGKKRSRSSKRHHGRRRSGKSRSRSRSAKRRHGRKRSMGRSRSLNADGDNKQVSGDGSEEQDDLGNNSQETTTSSNTSRNDDDGKSVKSNKSSKSAPNNGDSQTSSEDKSKHADNDNASNDDDASEEDDDDNNNQK